jgi:hypothetical protein
MIDEKKLHESVGGYALLICLGLLLVGIGFLSAKVNYAGLVIISASTIVSYLAIKKGWAIVTSTDFETISMWCFFINCLCLLVLMSSLSKHETKFIGLLNEAPIAGLIFCAIIIVIPILNYKLLVKAQRLSKSVKEYENKQSKEKLNTNEHFTVNPISIKN